MWRHPLLQKRAGDEGGAECPCEERLNLFIPHFSKAGV